MLQSIRRGIGACIIKPGSSRRCCCWLRPQSAQTPLPFAAVYTGDFTITFGTGPNGTNDLRFSGSGLAFPLGLSDVDGHSTTQPRPDNPLISDIVTDEVTLTDANGDELRLMNSGSETLYEPDSEHPYIVGSGTFKITGGTGRYAQAKGSGTFHVFAQVAGPIDGGVGGEFVLVFAGSVTR